MVVAPAGLFASLPAYRSIRYELRSISARDECTGTDLLLMQGALMSSARGASDRAKWMCEAPHWRCTNT